MIKKIFAVATAGTVAWAGISAVDNTTRDESGTIVAAGDLGAFVTQVGDCLNGIPDGVEGSVDVLDGVPCTQAHQWQVFHKENLDLQNFDEVLVNQRSQELCDRALDSLVYDLSDAKFEEYKNAITKNLQPTLDSWANEDRIVDCLLGSDSQFYYSSIFN
jgi:hypothetical protein